MSTYAEGDAGREHYERLISIGQQITRHRQRLAKPRVEGLVLPRLDPSVPNPDLLAHMISESLLRRIDRNLRESKNIYVQQYDTPQITLFYRLAQAIPFIAASHYVANRYILDALAAETALTVVDIGIGNGLQADRLLDSLATRASPPETVTVVGIDPAADSLERCRESFTKKAQQLPFALDFRTLHGPIEQLTDEAVQQTLAGAPPALAINSAFALHHTGHEPGDVKARTHLLQRLVALSPRVLTLAEPHSNHDTESLVERLHNAWNHFGAVFDLIDRAAIDAPSRYLIKEKFFGREVRDIFGVSDRFRCERHETFESWLLRLHRAGFEPAELSPVQVKLPSYCSVSFAEGLVRFLYGDTVIVAVFGYRPTRAGSAAPTRSTT